MVKKDIHDLSSKSVSYDSNKDLRVKLCEEQMKISKNKVQKAEVFVHKEVLTEEKNITIPIKREELVIEKTVFNSKPHDKPDAHTKVIRIPISEERICMHKEKVFLEDVSLSKCKYKEVKHITETLKKEIPCINIKGDIKV